MNIATYTPCLFYARKTLRKNEIQTKKRYMHLCTVKCGLTQISIWTSQILTNTNQ